MGVKCYYLSFSDRVARFLSRYSRTGEGFTCETGWHQVMVRIEDGPLVFDDQGDRRTLVGEAAPLGDVRWPTHCECGYEFLPDDVFQLFTDIIYIRSDNNEEIVFRDAGPGAMWDAWWYSFKGPDGLSLVVKCPDNREWTIDGQCNNCTKPEDFMQLNHHCWTRTGTPPNITVGKDYGPTCSAGGGSIQTAGYHGHLLKGEFTRSEG